MKKHFQSIIDEKTALEEEKSDKKVQKLRKTKEYIVVKDLKDKTHLKFDDATKKLKDDEK